MPRYSLSDAELDSLASYLNSASSGGAPGVTDTAIHSATVITDGVDGGRRKAMLDVSGNATVYSALKPFIGGTSESKPWMTTTNKRSPVVAAALLAVMISGRSVGQELDFDAVLAPVIGLEARIPEHARSAQTLGTVRGGTGVIIDGAGLVLTIGYLILEASSVELLPGGLSGKRVPADVVAWDQATGLGLLRSRDPLNIAPMPLGESAALRTDDAVIAVSWERGQGMLPAVITGRRTYAGYWEFLLEDALYVAPIHPGFPGAALIGLDGKLVGIGGFAHFDLVEEEEVADTVFVPVDALKPILADLLLDGRSPQRRPWLGLYCEEIDGGLRVRRLPANGPAAKAGIQPGDRLMAVANTRVVSLNGFYRRLWSAARPGDSVTLELRRDETPITVEVEATDRYDYLRLEPRSQ